MDQTGSAKVTKCNHFFHGKCLRKWLYVQDSCPLCYGALYEDKDKKDSNLAAQDNGAPIVAANEVHEGLIDHDHAMERPIDDSEDNDSSNSSGDSDIEVSIARNGEDFDELADDTETSESEDDESHDNDEASWSCSDEDDDILYDSMEDCEKIIHSEETSLVPNTSNETGNGISTRTAKPLPNDGLTCFSSNNFGEPSQLNNTTENNYQRLETQPFHNHMSTAASTMHNDDQDSVIDSDTNS